MPISSGATNSFNTNKRTPIALNAPMIHNREYTELIQILVAEELSQPIDESVEHPVDDVNLMEAWTLGDISEETRDKLICHLADCVYCRRETSAMVRGGLLNFRHAEPRQEPRPAVSVFWSYRMYRALAAVAAVLLVAFMVHRSLLPQPQQPGGQIARIEPSFPFAALRDYETSKGIEDNTEAKTIEEIISEAGIDPEKRFEAGLEFLKRKEYEKAIQVLEALDQEFPDNAAIQNALGIAHYNSGNSDEAERCFEKAKQFAPENDQIQKNLDRML